MKKTFSSSVIVLCLLLWQMPYSFGQDTRREKQRKEANTDDMPEEEDVPASEEETQTRKRGNGDPVFGIGVEGGAGVNMIRVGGSMSKVNVGGTIGGFADIKICGRFYVQPGLYYVMNGGSDVTLDRIVAPYGLELRITTLELPVMIAYKSGTTHTHVRFTIGAGGYFAYNAGANLNGIPLNIGSDPVNDDIKATEAGVGLNAGIELRNGLFFRIKSQWGLTNLQPYPNGPDMYTSTHIATIGYLIRKRTTTRHYGGRPRAKDNEYIERKM